MIKAQTRSQGCPQKKQKGNIKLTVAKQAQAPCLGPSQDRASDGDTNGDTGTPDIWDPHVGLKPLALDDCGSDADIKLENDLPYGAESEVSGVMVDMMVDLDDCNV